MIQVYLPENEDYSKNGDMALMPTKCEVSAEINGAWQLVMEHPTDPEGRWKYIRNEGVIRAPLFGRDQLFVIRNVSKGDLSITVNAEPIFMRAMDDCILLDVRPTDKTGQQALDIMMAGTQYHGVSDITKSATAYYVRKNLIEAIGADDDNSFLNRWGGEIWYDDFTITINQRIGSDRHVRVSYGHNIKQDGFTEETDTSEVCTRIYPSSYNGHTISGETPYVDSPNIGKYPHVKARFISYDDIKLAEDANNGDEENGTTVCQTQAELDAALRKRAAEEFENGIDAPKVNIKADMVLLANTTLYSDVKQLEDVYLGDDVKCVHSRLGVETDARVISCVYDCLKKRTVQVEIGDAQYDFFRDAASALGSVTNVVQNITDGGNVRADMIQGIIDMMNVHLRAQKDIAQKQDVRAILFEDIDPASPTFGALSIGTQGIQISRQRDETGTDWKWGTAIDSNTIYANMIITGILTDKLGNFYLDMDNGTLKMKNGTFTGSISGSEISGGTITGGSITGSTVKGSTIEGNTITGGSININNKFKVDSNGNMTATGADVTGEINATSGKFSGDITASKITGSTITGNTISGGTVSGSSISGGSINGSSITGGTISGSNITSGNNESNININGGQVHVGYNEEKNIGYIGSSERINTNWHGITFCLEPSGDYMGWYYRNLDSETYFAHTVIEFDKTISGGRLTLGGCKEVMINGTLYVNGKQYQEAAYTPDFSAEPTVDGLQLLYDKIAALEERIEKLEKGGSE